MIEFSLKCLNCSTHMAIVGDKIHIESNCDFDLFEREKCDDDKNSMFVIQCEHCGSKIRLVSSVNWEGL